MSTDKQWLDEMIRSINDRVTTLNHEHGETRDKVIEQGTIINNLCECFTKLDSRVWLLVTGTGLGFIITIFLLLLNMYAER
jgi:hypothetical protein